MSGPALNRFLASMRGDKIDDEGICLVLMKKAAKSYTCTKDRICLISSALKLARKDSVEWGARKKSLVAEMESILEMAVNVCLASTMEDIAPLIRAAADEDLLSPASATAKTQLFGRRALVQIIGERTQDIIVAGK